MMGGPIRRKNKEARVEEIIKKKIIRLLIPGFSDTISIEYLHVAYLLKQQLAAVDGDSPTAVVDYLENIGVTAICGWW